MGVAELICARTIVFDDSIETKRELLRAAARLFTEEGYATDAGALREALREREREALTGIEGGFGIPHAKSACVVRPGLAFFRTAPIADYVGSDDTPIDCAFVIVCPEDCADEHLEVLSALVRCLVDDGFRRDLRRAPDAAGVRALLCDR